MTSEGGVGRSWEGLENILTVGDVTGRERDGELYTKMLVKLSNKITSHAYY